MPYLLLSTLASFGVGPISVAHVILIHVKRLTYDLRTSFVPRLPSFSVGPISVAHVILIHVKRLTYDFRTAFVTLLGSIRPLALLRLIAM